MIGSLVTRALALVLGYAYPAFECYKAVELNKPEIEQLRFWCQYWILVAALTVFERVGESFVSWLPMYSEAKVAFFVYLWYPKTRGTAYVYETFFQPYVAKHETEIDRNLLELRTRAGDMIVLYSQRIASYGQTRIYEILQYVASQSPSQSSRPRPAQQQRQQPQQVRQTALATSTRQPAVPTQPQHQLTRQQPPPAISSKSQPQEPTKTLAPSSVPVPSAAAAAAAQSQSLGKSSSLPSSTAQPQTLAKALSIPISSETVPSSATPSEPEAMEIELANNATSSKDSNPPPPQETTIEEAIRVTRGRLRKRAATGGS
ncbi:uncharacterized protein A4U43_C10F3050 [Asparagus officinalis]|uniref:HVA22-like protein n=1 Tax=Asparagus officinalis TaxID=4686 RepID=A0A5P1E0A1_ASPOF|nr:HVA22-like protein i [Asparagus officinalis]ONK55994.1 uncharacterized protein A4U43_C10F3050 [Asparagus officinalis]